MQLVCRRVDTATGSRVVVAVQALPVQLECAVSSGGGVDRLCDPAFRVGSYLLVNPLLQTRFVFRSPTAATQLLTREVVLRVLLNLLHRVIGEVRTNDLHASGRDVLTAKGAHGVVVQTALQNVEVPESLTSVNAVVIVAAFVLSPLVFRQVLRQLILLRVLDGHAGDLVATPCAITLRGRRRVCSNTREDTSCRLVHQTVLIRHVIRKLRPHANLLTLVVTLTAIRASGQASRCIRVKVTSCTGRIGVWRHVDGEVTVFITLGVVHRGRVLSVFTLIPLGVDLNALECLTGFLNLTETDLGLYDFLHGTGDGALLVRLTRRVDGLAGISCRFSRIGRTRIRVGYRTERGIRECGACERAHHTQCEGSGRKRHTATTGNTLSLHAVKISFREGLVDKTGICRQKGDR